MVPIWKRPKSEVKDEEYNEFYKSKFMDYTDRCGSSPAGPRALPPTQRCSLSPAPPRTTTTPRSTRRSGLYASGVMIMEKCGDLLPDYFSFVKGVVDSEDLSMNISVKRCRRITSSS